MTGLIFIPRVQRWLEWLDLSWFGHYYLTDRFVRALIHLVEIPYKWFRLLQILWLAKKVDLIFIQAVSPPVWYFRLLTRLNQHIIYDYDDAFYVENEKKTRTIVQGSWKVFAGSHALFDYAKRYNSHVVLLPSSISPQKYSLRHDEKERSPLRIGWIGSASTLEQLQILTEPFKRILEQGCQFEFLVAGSKKNNIFVSQVSRIKIIEVPSYQDDEIPALVDQIDIGVMPLFDTAREQGRCAFKTIIYMAGQIPVVCSPVGEANYIVKDGLNGFFANSPQEWVENLTLLLQDKALRRRIGDAGRKTIEEKYTQESCFKIIKGEMIEPLR